jgi:hypothetical protein
MLRPFAFTGAQPTPLTEEAGGLGAVFSQEGAKGRLPGKRFGFSVTYYENNRPRQFYPDFIVTVRTKGGKEIMWLAETKGEMRTNVPLKNGAARLWCEKMSGTRYGQWDYLFAQQIKLTSALATSVDTFEDLADKLRAGF